MRIIGLYKIRIIHWVNHSIRPYALLVIISSLKRSVYIFVSGYAVTITEKAVNGFKLFEEMVTLKPN
jgi:hypothetical protein